MYPLPTSPRILLFDTLQSCNITVQVELALIPNFFSFFPIERPGFDLSTKNAVIPNIIYIKIPLYPLEKSTLAITINKSASFEFEIHIFSPLRT